MGQKQDTNSCCMDDKKESVLEISLTEPLYRSSSYESPIPDEVCTFEITANEICERSVEEWSTDLENHLGICTEPSTNTPKKSRISSCSKKISVKCIDKIYK
ncbi:hypothetical protein SteCoe_21575 [Stentor coeruleus]|uniref:Uncharacterized protein n=1 Tax=Stentor coeruleus TaxID=5963 RepID=A0A1R2BPS5_9CILI|nr:hypothetical protein SteCoe_21575 [Stentor coeruleus]